VSPREECLLIINNTVMKERGVYVGNIEEHQSVVKGVMRFTCGCGDAISLRFRKDIGRGAGPYYRFEVTHRNKKGTFSAKDPNALVIFDKMHKVSSGGYKTCRWPR